VTARRKKEKAANWTTVASTVVCVLVARAQFHQLFTSSFLCTKVSRKVFLYLHFRFEQFFWRKNIGANALINCW
jgi:hypothetical protein